MKKLADEGVPVEVEFIGDGPFADAMDRQASRIGVENHLTRSGELLPDEVARRLADADIFCMASFAEGLPISIMEAMALGVPVVTTWVGGIPELAQNEVTALTVPPGNSDALAAAIKRLTGETILRKRLVVAARAAVERMHSRAANADKLTELYRAQLQSRVRA
jgi:glycosyltransferase involved in cell wall biosynthesis